MEVLPVHVIQGLYEAVHSVAALCFFIVAKDIAQLTTVITVNHLQ